MGRRGQARDHGFSSESGDHRLLPPERARNRAHVSPASGNGDNTGRTHGRAHGRILTRTVALEDLWRRHSRRPKGSAKPQLPPDPQDDREDRFRPVASVPWTFRLELQVFGGAHVLLTRPDLRETRVSGGPLRVEGVAHAAQRRYL